MFVRSVLSERGAKNLYWGLKNTIDYEKEGIDEERYIKRLDYLYGWLYTEGYFVDDIILDIHYIEKYLFSIYDSEVLLTQYEDYKHFLKEYEDISSYLVLFYCKAGRKFQISEHLLRFFDEKVIINGHINKKRNSELINKIRENLLFCIEDK